MEVAIVGFSSPDGNAVPTLEMTGSHRIADFLSPFLASQIERSPSFSPFETDTLPIGL